MSHDFTTATYSLSSTTVLKTARRRVRVFASRFPRWVPRASAVNSYFGTKTVLVTGAASGLGRSLALELAAAGATLVAVDIDVNNLSATVEECRQLAPGRGTVHAFTFDVADPEKVSECADRIQESIGQLDVLINNAGVLAAGHVTSFDLKDYRRVMETNFFGTLNTTKSFLPLLEESPAGHLVNVSSAFGMITAPGYSAYSASKFAVRALTEAMAGEFAETNLKVTSVIPGGLHTDIARSALYGYEADRDGIVRSFEESIARTTPGEAATRILAGVASGKHQILVGQDAAVASALARLLGPRYMDVIRRSI